MINFSKKMFVVFSLIFSLNLYSNETPNKVFNIELGKTTETPNKVFNVELGKTTLAELKEIYPNLNELNRFYYVSNKNLQTIKLNGLDFLFFEKNNIVNYIYSQFNKSQFKFLISVLKSKYDFIGKSKNEAFTSKKDFYNNKSLITESNKEEFKKEKFFYNSLEEYSFTSKDLFISLVAFNKGELKNSIGIYFYETEYYKQTVNNIKKSFENDKNKILKQKEIEFKKAQELL